MANVLKRILPGTEPLASDIDQIVQALLGLADIGIITLAPPCTPPAAPTLTVNGQAGNLNGTYKYQLVHATGWVDSDSNIYLSGFATGAEASLSVTNGQVNVTLPTFSPPIVATLIYRTAAGGASGSEQYVGIVANGTITSFTDNVADGSLGVTPSGYSGNPIPSNIPTADTTGTDLGGLLINQAITAAYANSGTLAQVISWYAKVIKGITGKTNWYEAPAATIATLWALFNGTTGHTHSGVDGQGPQINAASVLSAVPGTGANNLLKLNSSGNAVIAGNFQGGKVFNATYNDYAEWFRRGDDAQAGDVVVKVIGQDSYVKCSRAYDPMVAGVVSSEATFAQCIGGDRHENMMDNLKDYIPVGLAGRVPVKVIGKVKESDLLVASDVPGCAMKAEKYIPGTVLGKALESNPDGKGIVIMLIMSR